MTIADRARPTWVLSIWVAVFACWRAAWDSETDAFWMAREGSALLAGGPVSHLDSWSWDPAPGTFVPTSTLWQVALGIAWQTGGRWGLFAFTASVLASCVVALAWLARLLGATPTSTVFALLPTLVLSAGAWTARAALPALVLLLISLTLLWRAGPRLRRMSLPTALVASAGLTFSTALLGIWLHNSWSAYAVALAAGCAVLSWYKAFGSRVRGLAITAACALGSVTGATLGPRGLDAWADAARVASQCRGIVVEWMSPWQIDGWALLVWIGVLLLMGTLSWSLRVDDGGRPMRTLLWLAAATASIAGAYAVRFSTSAAVIAMPLLASALARGLPPRFSERLTALGERRYEPYWRTIATLLLAVMLPVTMVAIPGAYATVNNPVLARLPRNCNLFSDDTTGSVAALARTDVRTWIDGRLDYWGRDRMVQLVRYEHADSTPLVPSGATCVVLNPEEAPRLARALDASPVWQRMGSAGTLALWLPEQP